MSIASIASKKSCAGVNSDVNTGKLGCLSLFGTPAHMIGFTPSHVIPAATTFDVAYLTPLVQKGTAVALIDASSFEDVSGEDSYSTNTKGIKRLNVKGLPEYRSMYEEGHEFYRELDKLEGYKNFTWVIGDTDGNWMLVKKSNGDFKGFTGGHTTPELTKRKSEGGDAESKSLLVQFIDRLEWDRNYEILHAEDLDFTPQEVPVINGVEITFDAAPGDTDTTFDVTVVLASDRSTGVEGLLVSDFVYQVGGSTVVPSNVTDNGNGNYTFTVAAVATGNVLTLDTWDGSLNTKAIVSNNVLYRNVAVATETVV